VAATDELIKGVDPVRASPHPQPAPLADDGCNSTLTTAPAVGTYDVFSVSPPAAGRVPSVCVRLRVQKSERNPEPTRRETFIASGVALRNAGAGS
jgi:hypothetical protein